MSEPENKPPKVVQFRPRDPNAPLVEFKQRAYDDHVHGRFLINERHGTIKCQLCGQFIPAFEAFCLLAEAWRSQDYKFKCIKEYEEQEQKKRDARMLRRIAKNTPPPEGPP